MYEKKSSIYVLRAPIRYKNLNGRIRISHYQCNCYGYKVNLAAEINQLAKMISICKCGIKIDCHVL